MFAPAHQSSTSRTSTPEAAGDGFDADDVASHRPDQSLTKRTSTFGSPEQTLTYATSIVETAEHALDPAEQNLTSRKESVAVPKQRSTS